LQAHFIAGQGERALDLLRREWGYMLYTNISVQSTLLEGFTANGSLGYVVVRSAKYYSISNICELVDTEEPKDTTLTILIRATHMVGRQDLPLP